MSLNNIKKNCSIQGMVLEVMQKLCCLVRMAVLPDSLHSLSVQQLQLLGTWPKGESPLTPWLPHCLRSIRWAARLQWVKTSILALLGR